MFYFRITIITHHERREKIRAILHSDLNFTILPWR